MDEDTATQVDVAGDPAEVDAGAAEKAVAPVREYARHGLAPNDYGRLFQDLAKSGLRPVWFDGYRVAGKVFYNVVWRPAESSWRAFRGLDSPTYNARVNAAIADGYSPTHVESYLNAAGGVRYAVILVRDGERDLIARHGLTAAEHQDVFAAAVERGLSPVAVSVVSLGGQLRYTVLYRAVDVGRWELRSRIRVEDFQEVFDDMRRDGLLPSYIAAYQHERRTFFSVIFTQRGGAGRLIRHGLDSAAYQQVWEEQLADGASTRVVTGYEQPSGRHRFAAVWIR